LGDGRAGWEGWVMGRAGPVNAAPPTRQRRPAHPCRGVPPLAVRPAHPTRRTTPGCPWRWRRAPGRQWRLRARDAPGAWWSMEVRRPLPCGRPLTPTQLRDGSSPSTERFTPAPSLPIAAMVATCARKPRRQVRISITTCRRLAGAARVSRHVQPPGERCRGPQRATHLDHHGLGRCQPITRRRGHLSTAGFGGCAMQLDCHGFWPVPRYL
jgi:hypothetical protein